MVGMSYNCLTRYRTQLWYAGERLVIGERATLLPLDGVRSTNASQGYYVSVWPFRPEVSARAAVLLMPR